MVQAPRASSASKFAIVAMILGNRMYRLSFKILLSTWHLLPHGKEMASFNETKERCLRVMEFAPPEENDDFAKRQLGGAIREYQNLPRSFLADGELWVNGTEYPTLLDAIYAEEEVEEFALFFTNMSMKPVWEYDIPTRRIKINAKSRGGLYMFPTTPSDLNRHWDPFSDPVLTRAMFRCFFRYYFVPQSIKTHSNRAEDDPVEGPYLLDTLQRQWRGIRERGIVPFELRLCAYTQDSRYVVRLNILENKQVRDFRASCISIHNHEERSPREMLYLDKLLSNYRIPDHQKDVLEAIYQTGGMTPGDLSVAFGMTDTLASLHMEGLLKKRLVTMEGKPPHATFRPDLDFISEIKGEF